MSKDIDEILMVLLPDENNHLENHNKRLRKYAKQAIQDLITKARIQSAVDIGKRLEIELAKRSLSSPPSKGARFMTDQEFIAQIVTNYVSAQLKEQTNKKKGR